jgi:hypothetical protein
MTPPLPLLAVGRNLRGTRGLSAPAGVAAARSTRGIHVVVAVDDET